MTKFSILNIVADCGSLENPLNGVVEFNQTTFGSVAEYSCNEGFVFMGNTSNRSCQANGRWTEEPTCIGKVHFTTVMHSSFIEILLPLTVI